jgi:hypothetical protein
MVNHTTLAIVAMVAVLGLLGVVAIESIITSIIPQHQAQAAGCNNGIAFNASKGRCFGH